MNTIFTQNNFLTVITNLNYYINFLHLFLNININIYMQVQYASHHQHLYWMAGKGAL